MGTPYFFFIPHAADIADEGRLGRKSPAARVLRAALRSNQEVNCTFTVMLAAPASFSLSFFAPEMRPKSRL
jgi:hypothetical protein